MVAIIDAHQHFFDVERFRYPLLEDDAFQALRAQYTLPEFLADIGTVDVVGSVHVQAEVDHATDPVRETAWLQTVADASGPRRVPSAIVGYADLRRSDLEDTLSRHCAHAAMRGIRQEAWYDPAVRRRDFPAADLLEDPRWRAGYRTLARFGLSFDLLVLPWQLPGAARFAAEVPDVPVILEHIGMAPVGNADAMDTWRAGLRTFARLEHAAVKISALGQIDPHWTPATIRPLVLEVIEIFGVNRCLFGSNFPVEKLTATYADVWSAFEDIAAPFSEAERNALFNGNARRVYRI